MFTLRNLFLATIGLAVSVSPIWGGGAAGSLSVGNAVVDWVGGNQADRFQVWLEAGQEYDVTADKTSGDLDPRLYVRTRNGNLIAQNDDGGAGLNAKLRVRPSSSGVYLIDVDSFGQTSGNYRLLVRHDAIAPPIGGQPLRNLSVGNAANEWIGGDQSGRFRVWLNAGRQYVITADKTSGNLDPRLFVRTTAGNLIAKNDDGGAGLNAMLRFRPGDTGFYRIDVDSYGRTSGNYRLMVRQDGIATPVDPPILAPSLQALAVGNAANGWVGANQSDRFQVWLNAGRLYVISADQTGGNLDPRLFIRTAGGNLIAQNDDGGVGRNAMLRFRPSNTGFYRIDVDSYGQSSGNYRLMVRQDAVSPPTAQAMLVGNSVNDSLGPNDRDRFRVWLDGGRQYAISADRTSGNLDPRIFLRTNSGSLIAQDDDSGVGNNALMNFRPGGSGFYLIDVDSYGSTSGNFRLLVH